MGQQICGINNSSYTKTLQQQMFNDCQVLNADECDLQFKQKLVNKFLNTQIVASWNILQQKSFNFKQQNLNPKRTLKSNKKIKTNKTLKTLQNIDKTATIKVDQVNNKSDQNQKQEQMCYQNQNSMNNSNKLNNQEQENQDQIFQNLKKKKYRHMKSSYQSIQIDVSSFIKVRTQNINDFYQFKQLVGQGTYGSVYKGIQKKSGQIRAVKVLKKKSMTNVSKMSFVAEIDILKTLDHPNIIKLYDLFLYDGHYYVITQFCEGGCLQKFFQKNRKQINEGVIKSIMKQLLTVLSYLNNHNLVHRDLKLQNIVFQKKPLLGGTYNPQNLQIKIIDFGTAIKVQKHRKNPSSLVGTLFYMAPEFTKGFFTEKCDIWSSGIILYLLLFKQLPFQGKTQKDILDAIVNKQINWLSLAQKKKVSKQALDLVKTMLDRNYLTRPLAATLLKNPFIRSASKVRVSQVLSDTAAQNLAQYNRGNNFVSLIESFLSFKKISQQQRQQYSKIFLQIDKDNSGLIDAEELLSFISLTYPDLNQSDIKRIIASVDKNNSGKLQFNEFLTVMMQRKSLYAQGALRQAFDFIDADNTGFISKVQVKNLLKLADKKQIQQVFKNLDGNGDNKIDFEEFKNYLLNFQSSQSQKTNIQLANIQQITELIKSTDSQVNLQ